MGQSTDGQLCFGVVFDEETEFPWDAEPFDGDEDEWWLVETGWKYDGEQPFTEDGDYAPSFSRDDPRVGAYFKDRREWKDAHPLPVELINYCSGDYPMWMIAVPATVKKARRGDPVAIDVTGLDPHPEGERALTEFCEKYGLKYEGQPSWWLSSYWG